MLCAISGEQPEFPVASRKSGNVFEKRLIETYIADNGSDPVTGEELSLEDIVELKSNRLVRPRPPTQTSVPALLATFQNEWDAIALETYEIKKQLAQTRQELSTALYDYEGALRILARVTKERDEARAALAKVQVGAANNGDSMEVDGAELSAEIIEVIDDTQKKLMATRRKRPIPTGWVTAKNIEAFEPKKPDWATSPSYGRCAALMEDGGEEAQTIVYGNEDGTAIIHRTDGPVFEVNCGSRITDSIVWDSKPVFSLADGSIRIYESGQESKLYSVHAGPATGISLHPSGNLLASVGSDKSYVLYDLSSSSTKAAARVFADSELNCCQFHPDGHIIALGGKDGQIKVFDVKSSQLVVAFETDGPVQSISFSENGTWLASASQGVTTVAVWDLRKNPEQAKIKDIEFGAAVLQVAWDYTAQFLAIVGGGAVSVESYQKSSKKWSELLKKALKSRRVAWDPLGQHLLVDSEEGIVELSAA